MSNTLLLTNPEEYAKRAVACLEYQLVTAKSQYRKIKLTSRIKQWTKTLELLRESDGIKEESAVKESE